MHFCSGICARGRTRNDPVPGVWFPAGAATLAVQESVQQRQVRARIRLALEGWSGPIDNYEQGYPKMKATYCGRDGRLKGKTALVRDDPVTCDGGNHGLLLAQFDDLDLEVDGVRMAFNWHAFSRAEFISAEGDD